MINVRGSDSPYLADWFAVSLRWLTLLGITVGLTLNAPIVTTSMYIILFEAIWNVFITILATLNRRLAFHRPLNLVADITFCLFLFQINGGVFGQIGWCSVLPIFSAAIYYEIRGGFFVGLLLTALQAGLTVLYSWPEIQWMPLAALAGLNIPLGLVMGFVSRQLMGQIRFIYQEQINQRKDAERKVILAERNRMQTFMSMVDTLSSTLNYRVVLDTVLDLCSNALGGEAKGTGEMVSAVLLFGDHDLRVEVARHMSPRDMKQIFPAEAGVFHEVLQTVEPCLSQSPATDPELSQLIAISNCKSALAVPLNQAMNAYGMMFFAHPDPNFFDADRVELLTMIANQAVIAIQNARLYQDVQQEKERIVQTQEEARKKLARDLHDGPIQSVAAIAMRVDVARHIMVQDVNEASNELVKIEDLARRTTKELRHMLFTLRPLALESEGLIAALQAMADKNLETYKQNIKIEVDQAIVNELELGKQTVVFYLVEEAVTNARKHAEASLIMVRLRALPQDKNIALLEILDNGKGFDMKEVFGAYDKRGSLGMINLRERTDLINGLLNMESAPGKGTRIRVFIPLTEEAADLLQRGKVAK
jgi:signal transduction histidine kinase